jgi:hypothetical protein
LIGIPAHARKKILYPVGRAIPGALGQLPAVLALHRSKQALQIGPYPPARLNPAKTRRDLLDQRIQLTRPIDSFIHCGHDHASMAAQFITAIPAVVLEQDRVRWDHLTRESCSRFKL